jgi:peptidoglycan hydrolase CwlO-like protein
MLHPITESFKRREACEKRVCAKQLESSKAQLSEANRRSKALHAKLEAKRLTLPAYKAEMRKLQRELERSAATLEEQQCTLQHCEREALGFARAVADDAAAACARRGPPACTAAKMRRIASLKRITKLTLGTYKKVLGL